MEAIEERLRGHVGHLAGALGERCPVAYSRLEGARSYLENCLLQMGYTVTHDEYPIGERLYRNIVVEKRVRSNAGPLLLVGAHYDTVSGSPGADDNASGAACLLELARAVWGEKPRTDLRFVAFTLEEPPYFRTRLMGSRVHARRCRKRGDQIVGMLALEMLGYYSDQEGSQPYPLPLMHWFYPSRGDFIALAGNFRSRKLVRTVARALKQATDLPVEYSTLPFMPGAGLSDNWSFWQEGYPALMVTDTAFYRNPHYHQPSDRPETLDYGKMAKLVEGLAEVLVQFAAD